MKHLPCSLLLLAAVSSAHASQAICTKAAENGLKRSAASHARNCDRSKLRVQRMESRLADIVSKIASSQNTRLARVKEQQQKSVAALRKNSESLCKRADARKNALETRQQFCAAHFPASNPDCSAGYSRNESSRGIESICKHSLGSCGTVEERFYDSAHLFNSRRQQAARTLGAKIQYAGKQSDGIYQLNLEFAGGCQE